MNEWMDVNKGKNKQHSACTVLLSMVVPSVIQVFTKQISLQLHFIL